MDGTASLAYLLTTRDPAYRPATYRRTDLAPNARRAR